MVRERNNTMTVAEMEHINQILRGSGQGEPASCFIDAGDLQDSSDRSWLSEEASGNIDYTKFGSMKKVKF